MDEQALSEKWIRQGYQSYSLALKSAFEQLQTVTACIVFSLLLLETTNSFSVLTINKYPINNVAVEVRHYRKLPRKGPSLVLKIMAPKVGHKAWQITTLGLYFLLNISSLTRSSSCIFQGCTSLFCFPLSNSLFERVGGGRSVQSFLPSRYLVRRRSK